MNMENNLFQKLFTSRQLLFTDGSIFLLKNRKILIDSKVLSNITKLIDNSSKGYELYNSIKTSFVEGSAKAMGTTFSFSFKDYFKWLTDIAMVEGWGKFSWGELNEQRMEGVIFVEDSPIAKDLINKVTNPTDHFIRGLIAGGASASLKVDIDVIEKECIAIGSTKCVFIFKPSDKFEQNSQTKIQLGH